VRDAVDAAAALQHLLCGWNDRTVNEVMLAPLAGCVAHRQGDDCVIFSLHRRPRVQFARVHALPPSFIAVNKALKVSKDWSTHLNSKVTTHV
jgi:hypothetical protein